MGSVGQKIVRGEITPYRMAEKKRLSAVITLYLLTLIWVNGVNSFVDGSEIQWLHQLRER